MPKHAGPVCDSVEWRRLNDYLWAGTDDHGPVGTIEHGRRFYAIDTSGAVIARCRDLLTAQAVLADNAEATWATGATDQSNPGRDVREGRIRAA